MNKEEKISKFIDSLTEEQKNIALKNLIPIAMEHEIVSYREEDEDLELAEDLYWCGSGDSILEPL